MTEHDLTTDEGTVGQIPLPADARSLSMLVRVDYADAFLIGTGPTWDRTAEQWARAILEDAPASTRNGLSKGWSSLGLERRPDQFDPAQSDKFVLGWPIRVSTPDVLLLGADGSRGMSGELLYQRRPGALLYATFVQLDNASARALWATTVPRHRRIVQDLLEQALCRVLAVPVAEGEG